MFNISKYIKTVPTAIIRADKKKKEYSRDDALRMSSDSLNTAMVIATRYEIPIPLVFRKAKKGFTTGDFDCSTVIENEK